MHFILCNSKQIRNLLFKAISGIVDNLNEEKKVLINLDTKFKNKPNSI